jgi:endoglucanase
MYSFPGTRTVKVAALALLLALSFLGESAKANPMLHAGNGEVLDAAGNPLLLRCVNLSPWLSPEPYLIGKSFKALLTSPSEMKRKLAELVGPEEAASFWQRWQDTFVTEEDFQRLARHGFNCVRLPLNYKFITRGFQDGKPLLDEDGLAPVDRAVAWGEAYGIYVMLDLHAAPGGQNPVPTVSDVPLSDRTARLWQGEEATLNQKRTIALWRALAARYAASKSVGGYDLLNEPLLPSSAPGTALAHLYADIVAAIRPVDPSHMIILEGDKYARDFSSLLPPPDGNVLYQFHEYTLFNRDWRTPNAKALEPFLKLRADSHMPLWLGEFGEESADWQRQMVELMRANRIGWAVWPWKRIDLGNGHPVMETIITTRAWDKLTRYLVGAMFSGKPSKEQAKQAMQEMLQAIRTPSCMQDAVLTNILGRGD